MMSEQTTTLDLKEMLVSGARELGLDLSASQADSCMAYLSELKKWNRKINLTAILDDRDSVIKHFLDSFSYCSGFSPQLGLRLLDMGSGPGFPALPIKIAFPVLHVVLVEAVKKKASFLRHIVRTLELQGVEVVDKRTGDLQDGFPGSFDIVTARAFAGMRPALSEGARFLKQGGLMILSRGPEETMPEADILSIGMSLVSRSEITLPFSAYRRAIWVFRKGP